MTILSKLHYEFNLILGLVTLKLKMSWVLSYSLNRYGQFILKMIRNKVIVKFLLEKLSWLIKGMWYRLKLERSNVACEDMFINQYNLPVLFSVPFLMHVEVSCSCKGKETLTVSVWNDLATCNYEELVGFVESFPVIGLTTLKISRYASLLLIDVWYIHPIFMFHLYEYDS